MVRVAVSGLLPEVLKAIRRNKALGRGRCGARVEIDQQRKRALPAGERTDNLRAEFDIAIIQADLAWIDPIPLDCQTTSL